MPGRKDLGRKASTGLNLELGMRVHTSPFKIGFCVDVFFFFFPISLCQFRRWCLGFTSCCRVFLGLDSISNVAAFLQTWLGCPLPLRWNSCGSAELNERQGRVCCSAIQRHRVRLSSKVFFLLI